MKNDTEVLDSPEKQSEKPAEESITGPLGDLSDIQITAISSVTRKRVLAISKEKPNSKKWFWVCPYPEYQTTCYGYEDDVDGKLGKEMYIVLPHVVGSNPKIMEACTPLRIYVYLTAKHRIGLWPLKLSGGGWHDTGVQAAEIGGQRIIRLVPDMDGGKYFIEEALKEPELPDWDHHLEGKSMLDLLNLGFRNSVIKDVEHQVIKDILMA